MTLSDARHFVHAGLWALAASACAAGAAPAEERALRAAPASVRIDGALLSLEAYAWRDFQPISPPGGRPLRVRVRVTAEPGGSVPDGIRVDALWVVQDAKSWQLDVQPAPPVGTVEALGANGPKLEPGTAVDVVARLLEAGGGTRWLRVNGAVVHRTD
jgi:hypothetical protein